MPKNNSVLNISPKYELLIIYCALLVAQGLSLLNTSVIWDDWCIWLKPKESFDELYGGVGATYLGELQYMIMNLSGRNVIVYRALTLLLFAISATSIYSSLKKFEPKSRSPFILTLFFAVLPIYWSRDIVVCLPYTIGLCMQALSIYCFIRFIYSSKFHFRLLSLAFQWLAFMCVNSTLVFALGIYLLMAIKVTGVEKFNLRNCKTIAIQLFKWIDFLILPFIFWFVRAAYWMPSGIYAETSYNGIKFLNIIKLPVSLATSFSTVTSSVIFEPFGDINWVKLICLAACLVIFYPVFTTLSKNSIASEHNKKYLLVGFFLFIAGITPYLLVGNIILNDIVNSRNFILLLFAYPFIIYGLLSMIKNSKLTAVIVWISLSVFAMQNINACLNNLHFNQKNVALEHFLIENRDKISDNENIFVDDLTSSAPILYYEIYHLSGISLKAIGKETRIVDNFKRPSAKQNWYFTKSSKVYNFSEVTSCDNFNKIIVLRDGKINLLRAFLTSLYYFTNREKYIEKSKLVLNIEIVSTN